mgnify:CR=1 FL=1
MLHRQALGIVFDLINYHTFKWSTESLLVSCTPPPGAPRLSNSTTDWDWDGGIGGFPLPESLQERPRLPCNGADDLRATSWLSGNDVSENLGGRSAAKDGWASGGSVWLQNGLWLTSASSPPSVMVCKLGEEPWRGSGGAGPGGT